MVDKIIFHRFLSIYLKYWNCFCFDVRFKLSVLFSTIIGITFPPTNLPSPWQRKGEGVYLRLVRTTKDYSFQLPVSGARFGTDMETLSWFPGQSSSHNKRLTDDSVSPQSLPQANGLINQGAHSPQVLANNTRNIGVVREG